MTQICRSGNEPKSSRKRGRLYENLRRTIMGTLTYILCVAITMALVHDAVCSRCPPRSRVPGYHQSCTSDYDCQHGMVCCPNWSNTKSCVYPAPYSQRISLNYIQIGPFRESQGWSNTESNRHQ
ncbi:uncharacterized protein LOC128679781 isoform X2 [Plodia interpunctella]|uniref:uncharacterized protein LOC128679781 isoform X2 n=1 Tax=Plodia interpunctella TaxID=58824 RepID=UPI002367EB2D|nr:uncharacterized protein LOC128679781 isoform X2 [Plodia interpunctella]